ncbi:hypothetical protein BGW80DRAFT_1459134 [Lactifluus volemus]|nr:hypothetical protein BGW80DRAFT_1459134 [Lactifluus volemus]
MFTLGLIALVLETAFGFQQVRSALYPLATGGGIWSFMDTAIIFATFETINCIMYILSDIICAWRAVILWNRDKRVIAILLLFILGNIIAAGSALVVDLSPFFNPRIHNEKPQRHALILVGTTFGINLLCTGLIGWKAWEHRVTIKQHLGECNVSTRVEKILAILIESGLVYCCLWIVYLIAGFGVFPEPFATAMKLALLVSPGAYPTLIIILVCMQKSPIDFYSAHVSGMVFANNEPPSSSYNQAGRMLPVKTLDEGNNVDTS